MAKVLNVNVISPEKILFSGNATYVRIPGSDGSFGVLYNHAALVSEVEFGILTIQKEDNSSISIFVDGGFAQISKNKVNILASSGEIANQINKEDIRKRIDELSIKKDSDSLLELKKLRAKLNA